MRSRYRCSMCPAIHINSRSWLRSSSTHEPSDPPLRVIFSLLLVPRTHRQNVCDQPKTRSGRSPGRHPVRAHGPGAPRRWDCPRTAGESGDESQVPASGDSLNLASHGRRPQVLLLRALPDRPSLRLTVGRDRYPNQKQVTPSRADLKGPNPMRTSHRTADSGRPSRAGKRLLSLPPAAAARTYDQPSLSLPTKLSKDNSSLMILPQVHLRKPCYDFYFL